MIFPQLIDDRPLSDLADVTRQAVAHEFAQVPDPLVLGFAVPGSETGRPTRTGF